MRPDLHVTTCVLPGKRIEIPTPDLLEGQDVEVTIRVPANQSEFKPSPKPGILDFLNSLPPSNRTPEEWAEFKREFQRERNSWDR